MAPKTVLITGCSDDGIGYGLALTFQKQGYQVFATARNLDKMTKLNGLSNVTLLQLDVTEPSQIEAAMAAVQAQTGGALDVLVNNAGRNHFMPYLDEDVEQVKALYDINVWGPLRVTKAFVPLLIKAQGSIAFITSISGYLNVPFMGKFFLFPQLHFICKPCAIYTSFVALNMHQSILINVDGLFRNICWFQASDGAHG